MKDQSFNSHIHNPALRTFLRKNHFTVPTPVQAEVLPLLIKGEDVTVQAPTGSGKTLAFLLPMLEDLDINSREIKGLIVCPTRELALQIGQVALQISKDLKDLRIAIIVGGESIQRQFSALRRRPQLIIGTPGRLLDHLGRNTLKLGELDTLILDEGDQMLDMGFRPDLERILTYLPPQRQTGLFSATFSKEVRTLIRKYQNNPVEVRIAQETLTVDSVEQFAILLPPKTKSRQLVALLREKKPYLALVFANTIRMVERVMKDLRSEGFNVACLHGDLRQNQRNRIMQQFRSGRIEVLVATDVAARGIDVANVDIVVNYDLPRESEIYVHRIGRTGRAGASGVSYTLLYSSDKRQLEQVLTDTKAKIELVSPTLEDAPFIPWEPMPDQRPKGGQRKGSSSQSPRRPRGQRPGQQGGPRDGSKPKYQGGSREGGKPKYQGGSRDGGKPKYQGSSREGSKPKYQGSSREGSKPKYQGGSRDGGKPKFQGDSRDGGKPKFQGGSRDGSKPKYQGGSRDGGKPKFQGDSRDGGKPKFQGGSRDGGKPKYQGGAKDGSKPKHRSGAPRSDGRSSFSSKNKGAQGGKTRGNFPPRKG